MPIHLVYDLTLDNQTFISTGNQVLQTPVAFAISLIGTFIGSTKGYDQFYSKKIEVTELRPLYKQDTSFPPLVEHSEISGNLIQIKGE